MKSMRVIILIQVSTTLLVEQLTGRVNSLRGMMPHPFTCILWMFQLTLIH